MKLSELIKGLNIIESTGDMNIEITSLCKDHRLCVAGSLFVCIEGFKADGHEFIDEAIKNGASAFVVQKQVEPRAGIVIIRSGNSRLALAQLSDNYFGHPSRKLKLAGITGTKGKTTITYMIRAIADAEGLTSGVIGTVENLIGSEKFHSQVTTPESYDLQKIMSYMVERGVEVAAMEVSSQGLALDRVNCCDFDVGVFTNLYNDHIAPNEHKDMEDYFSSKLKLFSMCKNGLVNVDFSEVDRVVKTAKNSKCEVITFGIDNEADIMARNIVNDLSDGELSVSFDLVSKWFSNRVKVSLPGRYNIYNALAAIGVCILLGMSPESIIAGLAHVKVRGRVEMVKAGQNFSVIVDYAHNAASLENLLEMLREYSSRSGGRIITVFGCGGDRATDRRFNMGEVSGRLSELTVITSDNPRTENPLSIIENIEEGIKRTNGKYTKITDRKEAIKFALNEAADEDIVVIAGKGHETTQVFSDHTIHFDDVETSYDILRGMNI